MQSRRFDLYLSSINANELKIMARVWGGHPQTRKAQCIAAIRDGLSDPQQVKAAVARLEPFEKNALAFVKESGGEIDVEDLALAIRMSGVDLPKTRTYSSDPTTSLIEPLLRRGLIMSEHDPNFFSFSSHVYYGGRRVIFSDARLLSNSPRARLQNRRSNLHHAARPLSSKRAVEGAGHQDTVVGGDAEECDEADPDRDRQVHGRNP